jgi:simple sugar transport system permease protein
MSLLGFRVERRERTSRIWGLIALLIALAGSLGLSALLVLYARADIGEAFSALFAGAFGSWKAFLETLVKATPLILTGLSITVAFQGKIWNIGAEGQLFAGAMAGYWVSANLATLPAPVLFLAILLAAFAAGALAGWIPGYLKARLGVDEVIVTVMLNYVILFLLSYLLADPWREPDQYYHMTPTVPEAAHFPVLFPNSRLHAGFLVALMATVLVYWLLRKTRLGYEIRAIGLNPTAAEFKGIDVASVTIMIMIISGGLAGVAGAGEVMGLHYRLKSAISTGYGFTGIIIAMLAGLNPFAVVPAAILFGGLVNGSNRMQIMTGVPTPVVYAMQAIVLLLVLATQVLSYYRLRKVRDAQ